MRDLIFCSYCCFFVSYVPFSTLCAFISVRTKRQFQDSAESKLRSLKTSVTQNFGSAEAYTTLSINYDEYSN